MRLLPLSMILFWFLLLKLLWEARGLYRQRGHHLQLLTQDGNSMYLCICRSISQCTGLRTFLFRPRTIVAFSYSSIQCGADARGGSSSEHAAVLRFSNRILACAVAATASCKFYLSRMIWCRRCLLIHHYRIWRCVSVTLIALLQTIPRNERWYVQWQNESKACWCWGVGGWQMTCQGFGEMLQYQCGVVVWKDDQIQRTRVRSSNPIILYLTMLGIAVLNACFPRCIGVESD